MKHMLRLHVCSIPPSEEEVGAEMNLRSAWSIQALLWKLTCTARVTWYSLKNVPNRLGHEA